MPAPTTFTPNRAFLGVAPETTPGTPVAPTMTVPITKPNFDDVVKRLDDPSIRGSMAALYGRYNGVRNSTFGFGGPLFVDTFGALLENMLGDRTTTGASDPYTHNWSLLNSATGQPKTHTFTYYTGIPAGTGARCYSGAALSDLSIMWDAEAKLLEYTCKGMAWGSTIAAAAPVAAPSAVQPFAAWRGQVGVAGPATGGTLDVTCTNATFELKRKLDLIYSFQNTQNPYVIQRGPLSVDGKMKFITVGEAPLLAMLNNTQQQFQILFGNGISGAGQRGVTVNMQLASWETAKLDEGKTATMWDVGIDGIASSADAGTSGGLSPIKVTMLSGSAGTVY